MAELTLIPKAKEVAKAETKVFLEKVNVTSNQNPDTPKVFTKTIQFKHNMSHFTFSENGKNTYYGRLGASQTIIELGECPKLNNKKMSPNQEFEWFRVIDTLVGSYWFFVKIKTYTNKVDFIFTVTQSQYNTWTAEFNLDLTITGTP